MSTERPPLSVDTFRCALPPQPPEAPRKDEKFVVHTFRRAVAPQPPADSSQGPIYVNTKPLAPFLLTLFAAQCPNNLPMQPWQEPKNVNKKSPLHIVDIFRCMVPPLPPDTSPRRDHKRVNKDQKMSTNLGDPTTPPTRPPTFAPLAGTQTLIPPPPWLTHCDTYSEPTVMSLRFC